MVGDFARAVREPAVFWDGRRPGALSFADLGVPSAFAASEAIEAFKRPAGHSWELTLLDQAGQWFAAPGHLQIGLDREDELFDRQKIQGAATLQIRIHEGTRANRPIES